VYRVSQRHGAALRGRQIAPGTPPTQPTAAGVSGPSEGVVAASAAKAPEAPLTPVESAGAPRTRLRGTAAREAAASGDTFNRTTRVSCPSEAPTQGYHAPSPLDSLPGRASCKSSGHPGCAPPGGIDSCTRGDCRHAGGVAALDKRQRGRSSPRRVRRARARRTSLR
jgi:hypothetical protein